MPRWAHNKLPSSVRQRYFELIRSGLKGSEAARLVGVSTSCGSLWFILDPPIGFGCRWRRAPSGKPVGLTGFGWL